MERTTLWLAVVLTGGAIAMLAGTAIGVPVAALPGVAAVLAVIVRALAQTQTADEVSSTDETESE